MLAFKVLFLYISLTFIYINCGQICYDGYGCFESSLIYAGSTDKKPIAALPESPSKINTTFRLYNKLTNSNGKSLTLEHIKAGTDLVLKTRVKFIVHGLFNNALNDWVLEMKDALLKKENESNVITVDWSNGNRNYYAVNHLNKNKNVGLISNVQ